MAGGSGSHGTSRPSKDERKRESKKVRDRARLMSLWQEIVEIEGRIKQAQKGVNKYSAQYYQDTEGYFGRHIPEYKGNPEYELATARKLEEAANNLERWQQRLSRAQAQHRELQDQSGSSSGEGSSSRNSSAERSASSRSSKPSQFAWDCGECGYRKHNAGDAEGHNDRCGNPRGCQHVLCDQRQRIEVPVLNRWGEREGTQVQYRAHCNQLWAPNEYADRLVR